MPAGRPRKTFDWAEIDKLLYIQCTDEEIAGWFDTDVKTIKAACRREKSINFSQYRAQKKDRGKISLRRRLWQEAHAVVRRKDGTEVSANTAALLFACKTLLGLIEYPSKLPEIKAQVDGQADIVIKWSDEDNTSNASPNPPANPGGPGAN